jgi:hypothetical protein
MTGIMAGVAQAFQEEIVTILVELGRLNEHNTRIFTAPHIFKSIFKPKKGTAR